MGMHIIFFSHYHLEKYLCHHHHHHYHILIVLLRGRTTVHLELALLVSRALPFTHARGQYGCPVFAEIA